MKSLDHFFGRGNYHWYHITGFVRKFCVPSGKPSTPKPVFQQDGAPPRWHLEIRNTLNEEFPQKWIGRGGPIPWPPRSPDIAPLYFFLWGYVKNIVYATKVTSVEQHCERIRGAIETVTPQMLQATWQEIEYRLDILRATRGAHMEMY
jgi:hypothetical protein